MVYLANVAAKRIDEGVVRGPAEVVVSEPSLARLGLTSTAWEDLLLTLPVLFEVTLAQYTKDQPRAARPRGSVSAHGRAAASTGSALF